MAEEHIALKEFIERIFDERQRALELSQKQIETRLESLNHLRAEVMRDRDSFVTKSYQEQAHAEVIRRLSAVESAQSRLAGMGIVLLALAGIMGALIGRVFKW